MICDCKDAQQGSARHVVFLEAKIVKYNDSAIPLKESVAKDIHGINSRINAQLTLRHRLARVLKERRSKGEPVEEDQNVWAAYAYYPSESSKKPRRLLKSLSLKLCDDFLLGVKDFWFVTLSSDNFLVEPYHNRKLRPLILDFDGQELWDDVKDHFGLIVYEQLDNILNPSGAYAKAREYFLPKTLPAVQVEAEIPLLRTENWDTFSLAVRSEARKSLQQIIENAINTVFGSESGRMNKKQYKGSDSFLMDRRTLIKIVPKHTEAEERLILAVLAGVARAAGVANQYFPDGPSMIGIGENAREFLGRAFTECPTEAEETEYTWAIEMILQLAAVQ
jgi:hypothetical protein